MLEAYAVGVKVSLRDGVTGPLGMISRAFLKANGDAALLQKKLDSIKLNMAVGGALLGAGFLGFAALKPALEQAKLLQEAQARFATFGLSPAANADALTFAKNMNIYGTSYVDALNRMTEAQGVFRESGKLTVAEQLRGAKLAAPMLAKIAFSQAALGRRLPGGDDASAKAMLRFIEMRGGLQGAEAFNKIGNLGFKAIQSSGGNVSWELYRQFMATGATAAQGLTNEELFGRFEPIIGELKGRAGTALATSYNRLEGITRVPNQVAHFLVDSGLWRKNDVIWNSMGGIDRFRDNKSPLVNHAAFEQTPTLWYRDTLLPLYAKMHLDQAGRFRENAVIFGRTGGLEYNLIDRQLAALQRSVDSQNKAKDVDQTYKIAQGTALGQEIQFRKLLNNLEASAGSAILPMMVSGLQILNPMLWALSTWTQQHPRQVKALMLGFAGLSAAMAFGGTVLLLKAAFEGLGLMLGPLRAALFAEKAAIGLVLDEQVAAAMATRGLAASIFSLRGALLLGAGAAAIWYASTHPVAGTFEKQPDGTKRWTPNWTKGTWMTKPMAEVMGIDKVTASAGSAAEHITAAVEKGIERGIAKLLGKTAVLMDGKPVARIVAGHMGDEAGGPSTGPSFHDNRMSPLRPDMAY